MAVLPITLLRLTTHDTAGHSAKSAPQSEATASDAQGRLMATALRHIVRDALVYGGKLAEDRVETRWTGESRQGVPTGGSVAAAANRVVDIAIH